jgi:hypothetical protein
LIGGEIAFEGARASWTTARKLLLRGPGRVGPSVEWRRGVGGMASTHHIFHIGALAIAATRRARAPRVGFAGTPRSAAATLVAPVHSAIPII